MAGDEPGLEHGSGQQLQTGVAGQRGQALAGSDAVAVLVHRENGDLELIDEVPQLRLAFSVRAVVPRELLQVEEAAFERARPTRRADDERIHLADQRLDVAGIRRDGDAAQGAHALRVD